MITTIKVAGLDPSMSNFGMVKGDLDLNTGHLSNIECLLGETKPSKIKSVRKNSQDLIRCREQLMTLTTFLDAVNLIFAEIPVGSQNARASIMNGMCIGLMATITAPLIQVTPSEVKIAATNNKLATKKEMIEWAINKQPSVLWLYNKKGEPLNKNEHLADALACIYAGVRTDEFKQARSLLTV